MLKKILVFIAAVTTAGFYACDKIEGPTRETVVVNDFCQTGIEDSIVHKKVLVEDYTGHLCGNCPAAGVYLNDTLKEIYGHCLVVISVHAGFFAHVCPNSPCPGDQPAGSFLTNFTTPVSESWNTFFGITGNPKGMIDRVGYSNGTHSKAYNAWAPAIAGELAKAADARLTISNTYNTQNRSLNVTVDAEFINALTGDHKLQVVLTEDSIVDWQEWYNHNPVYVSDYVHHHVLRDALNFTWGETIVTGAAAAGTSVEKNYNYTVSNLWNADRCSVVAFIYNDVTKEVIQVEEARIN